MVNDVCLRLETADNFRDVAGPGYPVPGGRMRQGVLFRSNRLELGPADLELISTLRLRAIHDLREEFELTRHPNVEIAGAEARHHVVPGINPEELVKIKTVEGTDRAMRQHYRGFVSEPRRRAGFASAMAAIIEGLCEDDRPQLFHCSAGKDRTGWLAAMVQSAVGVDWADVVTDFLLTDEYTVASRQRSLGEMKRQLGSVVADALAPAWTCSVEQLEEARLEADRVYGGVAGYLREGLGLDDDALKVLRERLVVTD